MLKWGSIVVILFSVQEGFAIENPPWIEESTNHIRARIGEDRIHFFNVGFFELNTVKGGLYCCGADRDRLRMDLGILPNGDLGPGPFSRILRNDGMSSYFNLRQYSHVALTSGGRIHESSVEDDDRREGSRRFHEG